MDSNRDIEVRKSGVLSIAICAGRAMEDGHPLDDRETVQALIDISTDSEAVMRNTATFALGVFSSPEASQQLHVLLGNTATG